MRRQSIELGLKQLQSEWQNASLFSSMSPGFFYRVFEYEYCYDNHAGTEAVQAQWLWLVLCFHIS